MASSIRHRNFDNTKQVLKHSDLSSLQPEIDSRSTHHLRPPVWLVIFAFHAVILLFIHGRNNIFPEPVTVSSAKPGQFIEELARRHLVNITVFGSRPTGSTANEVKVVKYLLKELNAIKDSAKPKHRVEIDSHRVSGTFTYEHVQLGGFASYYDNVNNILVRLSELTEERNQPNETLLINCHYDTVFESPGASDDAVSCALMLEVLRVLSQSNESLMHDVIFLFNGAEENFLQASHGFITQHPWAQDVRGFVNLEAAGAGGKELVFQAGPENLWMIELYSKYVPHPMATVVGQELFETGVVPGDTDFRVFRDFGGLSGLDIAYITNGYVYHTPNDEPEMIPPGCIQRGGENLLALVTALANSPLLADPGEYRHGKLVFFDLVGLFMVHYPARIGNIINSVISIVVLIGIGKKITGYGREAGIRGWRYVKQLILATFVTLTSWVVTFLAVIVIAFVLTKFGSPMAWYTNTWLLFGLYVAPAIAVQLQFHKLSKGFFYSRYCNLWAIEEIYHDAVMFIWTLGLITLTLCNMGAAVVFLILVLMPLMCTDRMLKLLGIAKQENHTVFLLLYLLGILVPSMVVTYHSHGFTLLFIPIMGRAGSNTIPDVFLGCLVTLFVVINFSYHTSLVYVTRNLRDIIRSVTCLFLVTVLIAVFSPVGFPYGTDLENPTRQRHFVHHIDRKFHDITGAVAQHDSGLFHVPFDKFGITPIKLHHTVQLFERAKLAKCEPVPYCGWPFYLPLLPMFSKNYYQKAAPPKVPTATRLDLISKAQTEADVVRMTFNATGPNHIKVYIRPRPGVDLIRWSVGSYPEPLSAAPPPGATGEDYFIYYSYGIKPAHPWQFWLDLQVGGSVKREQGLIDIALGGHHMIDPEGKPYTTPELEEYVEMMPDWTVPTGWVATYESWVY